jgi:CRP/FNR family cyclic AMP-dependent transcriptional regulator
MRKQQAQKPFDPSTFMAAFDGGVTVSIYGEGQIVFSQDAPADAVFYIQDGKVKLTVVSSQGKEAVVAFMGSGDFCGEGKAALPANSSGWPRRWLRPTAQSCGLPNRA